MTADDPSDGAAAASPSAAGPAGPLFEGRVGAHYLLTMLAEADPRGLPGVQIEQVEFQRAGEGHPLDDIVVRGFGRHGRAAVLEVQVKRTITFSPADPVFKDVVGQLSRTLATLDVASQRHEFAVATERTSFKITGPYQDVLRWAREVGSASVFMARIERRNVGNDDMRTFVATVRSHLDASGCASDDETVWQVLRRFQILTFDYDAPGSQSEELALERARNLLESSDASRAGALWKVLIATALRTDASGGDFDRARLLTEIASVEDFRLLGTRRNRAARETLSEITCLAKADLRRTIAGVTLARSAHLEMVRDAQDRGRYVEIRGSPGVGKSALLGMLVDQVLTEGRAIVLSPDRTPSGGWLSFKSLLGVDTTAEAFLTDLANDGGATLFIDSLDFFNDGGQRATVVDLVQAAGSVPGFRVVVTARTDFGKGEPNWLPADALTKLGPAPPVIIKELRPDEVEELRAGAPNLRALLADDHPARDITRNLFQLSRLLEVHGSADQLRSEVDILERWWVTADGPPGGRRERGRILRDLSDVVLDGGSHLETRAPPSAVDALLASETLRELEFDQLTFRHDVLRDWAVAARLRETPDRIGTLKLSRPAPASLARGVELGSRFALERADDGQAWTDYLARVSPSEAHPSWRRWSLLAILRSERALTLLDRAADALLDNDGLLLREVIRTALAVESEPLAETVAKFGMDAGAIPAGISSPTNTSWARLAQWLLKRRADLPIATLPDVVELFQSLSVSMFARDPLTPLMAIALADWLDEIEEARDHGPFGTNPPRFAASLGFGDLAGLATDVRRAFVLMAARVPERAQSYLRKQLDRPNADRTISQIMKFRGSLARAAPAELVELTLAGLIPEAEDGERDEHSFRDETFTFLDHDFLPSSPAQGPFLDLLNAAPEQGLRLVRRLVEHAVTVRSNGAEPGDNGFSLMLSTGQHFFPWQQTYAWSRQMPGGYCVESGLLAMEAWAHSRLEGDDPPEQVIADVLGPEGSPAAFLLIAVDLIISHWPKTKAVAVPFMASPELLTIDRERQIRDGMPDVDLFGLDAVNKEPAGAVQLTDLKKRPSRRFALESLLATFAFEEDHRDHLRTQLEAASARLGAPEPADTLAEPRFMARHALNVIDPVNWKQVENGFGYVSPPEEAQHLGKLQRDQAPEMHDWSIDAAIQNALERPASSDAELVKHAVEYAQRLERADDDSEDVHFSRTHTIVSAALILARDGTDAQLDKYEGWARNVLCCAFEAEEDRAAEIRNGIRFNPAAIATLALVHLWHRGRSEDERQTLLQLATRDGAAAAHGFGAGLSLIRSLDPRLPRSLLRCALQAQIRPNHSWDTPEQEKAEADDLRRLRVSDTIAVEDAWLRDGGTEPAWPVLPPRATYIRHGVKISADEPLIRERPKRQEADRLLSQSAALWVRLLTRDTDPVDLAWIVEFVNAYADWTAAANGAGLEPRTEIGGRPDEWNDVFYRLVAYAMFHTSPEEAASQVEAVTRVPDQSFFDIVEVLIPAIDRVYFDSSGLAFDSVFSLRSMITDRLLQSAGWRWERDRTEMRIEMRIGPAIAPLFFNRYSSIGGAECYLLAKGIDQLDLFFPLMTRLIVEGSVPFTSLLTMNLLEVSPRREHLAFMLESALTWLRRQPANSQLWVDNGLGARVAKWLGVIIEADTALRSASHPLRPQIDDVLAQLVKVGVAEAHRLEATLAEVPRG